MCERMQRLAAEIADLSCIKSVWNFARWPGDWETPFPLYKQCLKVHVELPKGIIWPKTSKNNPKPLEIPFENG